jgi:hypothetical protein
MIVQNQLKTSEQYRTSYIKATEYIDSTMRSYSPAMKDVEMIPLIEERILEYQILASNICPTESTKKILRETACRIIPYGSVAAKTREYKTNQYYIILDCGTIDFLSNLACLHFAIFEQNNNLYDYSYNEQAILTKFFQLGLVYYDSGLKTKNENLVYPHFHSSYLQENTRIHAYNLFVKSMIFYVLHEFGHIIDNIGNNDFDANEREFSADFFSLTALRSIAESTRNNAELEMSIMGCLLAILSINFIEKTFPDLEYIRENKTLKFPEKTGNYPSSNLRLKRFWDLMPPAAQSHFKNHPLIKSIIDTYDKYSNLIIEGKRPTNEYWDFMESILKQHKNESENWNNKHSQIFNRFL